MHAHLSFSLPLTLATLLQTALSHGAGEDATSVPVSSFKTSFTTSSIVPDVLAAFNPSLSFYAGYTASDGDAAMLMPGTVLTAAEAKMPFEMSVENIADSANVTADTRFIVYMIGPDVPSRSTPTSRNIRHYLAGNLTITTTNSTVMPSAVTLTNSSAATNEYVAPTPAADTGAHRYVYLLYTQPVAFNTAGFESLAGFNVSNRTGFNLTQFRTQAGLGASVGGTWFEIETDKNATTTNASAKSSGAGRVGGGGVIGVVVGLGVAIVGLWIL